MTRALWISAVALAAIGLAIAVADRGPVNRDRTPAEEPTPAPEPSPPAEDPAPAEDEPDDPEPDQEAA